MVVITVKAVIQREKESSNKTEKCISSDCPYKVKLWMFVYFFFSEGGSPKRNSVSPKADKTATERRHPVSTYSEYWIFSGARWSAEKNRKFGAISYFNNQFRFRCDCSRAAICRFSGSVSIRTLVPDGVDLVSSPKTLIILK